MLKLVIKKKPFEVMQTGEKLEEYRKKSKWIESRLIDKKYDYVEFYNGYRKDRPSFIMQYNGYELRPNIHKKYSNGLKVDYNEEVYVIKLKLIEDKTTATSS